MRRGRILILFGLLLVVGVVVFYMLFGRPAGQPPAGGTPAAPVTETTNIVMALQEIPRGAEIGPDMVGLMPFPRDQIVETMIENDSNQVIGRHARMGIPQGSPITTNMITMRPGDVLGAGSDASMAIPFGYTAISIPMTRLSGVAYALRPGDMVDVIVTMLMVDLDPEFQSRLPDIAVLLLGPDLTLRTGIVCQNLTWTERGPECTNPEPPEMGRADTEEGTGTPLLLQPSEPQRPRLVTQRLIQNASVLHVGSFTFEGETQATVPVAVPEGQAETQTAEPIPTGPEPPDIVTLIVSPQDALALNWAVMSGSYVTLTLRAPGDTAMTETVSVTLQYLMQNYSITVPTRLPYGLEPAVRSPIPPVLPNDVPPVEP
jgi:pilus assembly protein CpaB